jgi:hypothetical protein
VNGVAKRRAFVKPFPVRREEEEEEEALVLGFMV